MSKRCSSCKAENPSTNRYCGQCGTRLPDDVSRDAAKLPAAPGRATNGSLDSLRGRAVQLARFYALLSPDLLAAELKTPRSNAEDLLEWMHENGYVGPVLIEHSRARRSLINVVEDTLVAAPEPVSPPHSTASMFRTLLSTAIGVLVGALVFGIMVELDVGPSLAAATKLVDAASPIGTVLTGLIAPCGLAWLLAWIAESFARPSNPSPSADEARRGIWTIFAVLSTLVALIATLTR